MMYMYCCTTMRTLQEQFDFFFTNEIDKDNDCYSGEDRSYIVFTVTICSQETNHS